MTSKRLSQLRDYAVALALLAEHKGVGCTKDLVDIVKALDELAAFKAIPQARGEQKAAA